MNKDQNFGFNSHNHNKLSNTTKFTAIIMIIFLIVVVSIFSKKSYASEAAGTINTSLLGNTINLLPASDKDAVFDGSDEFVPDTTGLKKGTRKLNFYEDENGKRVHYKAKLRDGKLTDLYIDGEMVPDNQLNKYGSKIQKKVDEYETALKEYRREKEEYKMLAKEYSGKFKNLHGKLRDIDADQFDFDFDFSRDFNIHISKPDLSELRESMRELKRELKDSFADRSVVIPPIHIPRIHIPPIHVPPVPPICFDEDEWENWNEELKANLEEFKEEMNNNKFNMRGFNENMKEFRGKMKEFGAEMKKFGGFIKEMKNELINDGIINYEDDIDELLLSEDKMEVNGESVSPELHKKYKDMYEKHTGKKIEGKNKIRIND